MANLSPKYELSWFGFANTVTKDDFFDLGSISTITGNSPIPSGKQIWLGFIYLMSQDKALDYELRVNNAGESLGTLAKTTAIYFGGSDPTDSTALIDVNFGGSIAVLAPIAVSTGVEKLWLRTQSGSATVGSFEWMIFHTLNF